MSLLQLLIVDRTRTHKLKSQAKIHNFLHDKLLRFFLPFYSFVIVIRKIAKILRKIKSTLQHRKNKSRLKSQTLNQSSTIITSGTSQNLLQQSPTVSESLQQQFLAQSVNQDDRKEISVEAISTSCKGISVEPSVMETNLNKVLNQAVRHQLNGLLCKYTNVMKGWQYRWFTVDPQSGILSYYLSDCNSAGDDVPPPTHVLTSSPRGQVHLAGAVVCPSDEDSRTFSIACASGDTIKLRASDARARQEWVDGLRAVVESHTKAMDINISSPLPPRELLAASDAMVSARQALYLTEQCNASLARAIENMDCDAFSPTDPDLLLLKAISTASTQCLHQCLSLLQRHQEINTPRSETTSVN